MKFNHFHLLYQNSAYLIYQPISLIYLNVCSHPSNQPEQPSFYDCKVLDGAVIVYCLPTAGVHTFNDYAEEVFVPYPRMQLRSCTRLDVVWDTYLPESLKDCTRAKRGKGLRRKVSGPVKLPNE